MNGQAIRKPEWEGCPNFSRAWDSLFRLIADPRSTEEDRDRCITAGRWLADARVVRVPSAYLWAVQRARMNHAGFVDGQRIPEHELREAGVDTSANVTPPFSPLWVELTSDFPSGILALREEGSSELTLMPQCQVDGRALFPCVVTYAFSEAEVRLDRAYGLCGWLASAVDQYDHDSATDALLDGSNSLLDVLLYLLSTSNIEPRPEGVSRQVRRNAERRGREIPLTIQVRRRGAWAAAYGTGTPANHSHQFEVCGHPQYHTRGPVYERCKDPAKRVMVLKEGVLVEAVRVWNPGCVKGEGEFIPKVRNIAAPADSPLDTVPVA